MDPLFDDPPGGPDGGGNIPEYSVSEISGAVKRTVEGTFGHVRVKGEVGRVSRPRSGHVYLDLKDDRAVLSGVIWKGTAGRLSVEPGEGDEVVATGRLTTFPGQSKYQIVIEALDYAGTGALLAKLERLKKALEAEGLFAAERKRAIPRLPRVIGVVTSPSGAVIRDILHRLADRFPVHVLVWPVAVQGQACAGEVAAAIRGFNALSPGGPVPRPDVLIVARGGGSVEDLWGFNEEAVVRAAAASEIPLISAVGHETDTTLIDLAADVRAPTPTAAAELAVPVRSELMARVSDIEARRVRALSLRLEAGRQRLTDLARALPRAEEIVAQRQQRLDLATARLPDPRQLVAPRRAALDALALRLPAGLRAVTAQKRGRLSEAAGGLRPRLLANRAAAARERLSDRAARLAPAAERALSARRDRLAALSRLLGSLGYERTLARGYAVVREGERVVTAAAQVETGAMLEIQFADGRLDAVAGAGATPPKKRRGGGGTPRQPSLFDGD